MVSPPVVPAKAGIERLELPAVGLDRRFHGGDEQHFLARIPGRRPHGLAEAGHQAQGGRPSDDLRRPDSQPGASSAHLPIYGLEDLVPGTALRAGRPKTRGAAGAFIAELYTAPSSSRRSDRAVRESRLTATAAFSPTCTPACRLGEAATYPQSPSRLSADCADLFPWSAARRYSRAASPSSFGSPPSPSR
jgi:hypothetical protein